MTVLLLLPLLTAGLAAAAPQQQPPPGPLLEELVLDGATVFTVDDVLWLLRLRKGAPLPGSPEETAASLQARYRRDGYAAAEVVSEYDPASRRLLLRVEEGRIDDIEFEGLPRRLEPSFRTGLPVAAGDVYNERIVREAVVGLLEPAGGGLRIGSRGLALVPRGGRRVLVIPIETRAGRFGPGIGTGGQEDFYSPVDGFAPSLALDVTWFHPARLTRTYVGGYVSYKFGREQPGYSFGAEIPLLRQWTVGGALHDVTATDDLWRITTTEQSVAALTFKNTFRDYYRRRGVHVFTAVRPGRGHEIVAAVRRDRHEPLENSTDYSFFRDDHQFRPNRVIEDGRLHAIVLAYTWDSRGLAPSAGAAYRRALMYDLFRAERPERFGARIDWTSEIAGRGLGGNREFDRHILNARALVPILPRQSLAGRALLGFSRGELPVEREFALGGIGSVHGYRFKEAVGRQLTLFNAEYRLDLIGNWSDGSDGVLRALLFYDLGRVRDPLGGSRADWLGATGVGLQMGPLRLEFRFRTDDIPGSRQVLLRISPAF